VIPLKDLSAPDRSIQTIARSIRDDPQGRALMAILSQTGGHMGVMMLNPIDGEPQLRSAAAGAIVWMQIHRQGTWLQLKEPWKLLFDLKKGTPSCRVGESAQVLADERLPLIKQTEGGLHLWPQSQDGVLRMEINRDGLRDKTSGTTYQGWGLTPEQHRVIYSSFNGTIMQQKGIHQLLEA